MRKQKKPGSAKIQANKNIKMSLKLLRKEIKADFRKQHDLYVNNLVGDVKANPKDFIGTSIVRKKRHPRYPPPL